MNPKIVVISFLITITILPLGIYISLSPLAQDNGQVCRFAKQFSLEDFESKAKVDEFLEKVLDWEKKFIRQVGIHQKTGLTYDGYRIDATTGQLMPGGLHYWTASSKESIHIALLAKTLEGEKRFYSVDQVFSLVAKKVDTFEKFHKKYPGYGGYFPWVYIRTPETQIPEPTTDFLGRVPSLDNGEMFWAALSLSQVWEQKFPQRQKALKERWDNITWKGMIKNIRRIFFNETTKTIRADSHFQDATWSVERNNYTNIVYYFLDDPYEGELFNWIVTLFGRQNNQFSQEEIDGMWVNKRIKLVSVNYTIQKLNNTNVTVQRGWWFSAHQQWKNLFMPYYLSPTYKRIQRNNEIARTWNAVDRGINGMYASVTGPADKNEDNMDYYSDCGIQSICFLRVGHNQTITPYSTFPLFLIDRQKGTKWFYNMIASPAGQNKYGTTEGMTIDGLHVSPVLTWDSKITTVLAILNGTRSIVQRYLTKNNLLKDFQSRIETEYSRTFPVIVGESTPIADPRVTVKKGRGDFTSCK